MTLVEAGALPYRGGVRRLLLLTLPLAVACSDEKSSPADAPTYHRDIRPLVEAQCAGCHAEGGIGPFTFNDYASLEALGPAVVGAVESGRMPPWLPSKDCRTYKDDRGMADADRSKFSAWLAGGMLEGDPADYVPKTTQAQVDATAELGPPSMELGAVEAYLPSTQNPDDYRCFVLDASFDEESFMRTAQVVPDQTAIVHHVILYLVQPQFAASVENLDAQEDGPGYTCFGGVGAGSPQPISGWTPGYAVQRVSDDAAIRIPAGSKLVLQMHYNVLSTAPSPDRTTVKMWMRDTAPPFLIQPTFLPHLGIDIAAGDAESRHERVFRNNSSTPWTLVGIAPHMHLLGTQISAHKVAANGDETCLLDVPRWDFGWQQTYSFLDNETVTINPGEAIKQTCVYDNSAENQPVVNGERLQPSHVSWGEGTLDEMCLNTAIFVEPYAPLPEPGNVCEGFQDCYDGCAQNTQFPKTGCVLQCGGASGCANCVLTGLFGCTAGECGRQSAQVIECLESCAGDADQEACVSRQCGLGILAYDNCAKPHIEAGTCEASISACGVSL